MLVPDHWAEARIQHRERSRRFTIRRFGWSRSSAEEAEAMARSRADDALARLLAGETIPLREPKVPYDGADGLPIREEVLSRHGEAVITRNSYGAHCLNVDDVSFADVDVTTPPPTSDGCGPYFLGMFVAAATRMATSESWAALLAGATAAALAILGFRALRELRRRRAEPPEVAVLARIHAAIDAEPSWNVRIYRTPAGFRLLATHATYSATSPEAAAFFEAVGADPEYVRMCLAQRCFRARLTGKPWRMGIRDRMRPRPGVWPVDPAMREIRARWVARYEEMAKGFSACRFLESRGSGRVDERVQPVIALHDQESRALRNELPLG